MVVQLVGKGNGNVVVCAPGEETRLYRLCIRFKDSLRRNNDYVIANSKYIDSVVKPLLGDFLLCPMEMVTLVKGQTFYDDIMRIYSNYVSNLVYSHDEKINIVIMPNLRPQKQFSIALYSDHFTKLYRNDIADTFILEIKPKWLYNPPSLKYCRNCTHNKYKSRNIAYCYTKIIDNPSHIKKIFAKVEDTIPDTIISHMIYYFSKEDNILLKLYNIQKHLCQEINCKGDTILPLLMTFRDVTCFIKWDLDTLDPLEVNVIDIDKKPSNKFAYWESSQSALNDYKEKVIH